jgi:uncharacterized glyoxalase superfamily protein PhnB
MKLNQLVPMLRFQDLEASSVSFYSGVLGFRVENQFEEWACLRKDGVELMLALPVEHEPLEKPVFTGSFYFHTENVDVWWERLKEKATVVYPIENFDYGMREFAIRDNNGYCLQFCREI